MENNFFSSAFSADILDMIQIQTNAGYDPLLDFSQITPLPPDFSVPDSNDDNSSNSDEKDVEPKPKDRKIKRREIVRKSETKRRERFKTQLDTLKEILFNHEQLVDMRKEKLTREDVLDRAIAQLAKYKSIEKQAESWINSFTQAMSLDPNNLQKHLMETEDLERTFLFLYGRELERVFTFHDNRFSILILYLKIRTVDMFFANLRAMEQIAVKLNRIEYQLYTTMLEELFVGICNFDIKSMSLLNAKADFLYKQAKSKSSIIPEMLGTDIRVFILTDQVCLSLLKADFVTAEKIWAECLVLGAESHINMMYINSSFLFEKYILGASIKVDEAFVLYQESQADPYCKVFGEVCLGVALINVIDRLCISHIQKAHQIEQGMALTASGVKHCQDLIGDSLDITMAPFLIESYLQNGLTSIATEFFDKIMAKSSKLGISGSSGRADLLRLQAEVISASIKESPTESKLKEIESQLRKAIKMASEEGNSVIELKCVNSLAKFVKTFEMKHLKAEISQLIIITLKKFGTASPSFKSHDVDRAYVYLSELS